MSDTPMGDTLTRFLRAIAAHVPAGNIEEVHVFTPMRQGGRETGVAVIAARSVSLYEQRGGAEPGHDAPDAEPEPSDDSWLDTDAPLDPDTQHAMPEGEPEGVDDADGADDSADDRARRTEPDSAAFQRAASRAGVRLTIYRASYSWTIKGVERGKWQVEVSAEADAPLATVDQVVRGVQRRSGDAADAEWLSGDAFRAALSDAPWSSARGD